jgi:hypothetical protein
MYKTAPALNLCCTDNAINGPVAAFHENVRSHLKDAFNRRVLIEPGHEIDAFERCNDGETVFQRIQGAVVPFAEALH